jgi:glycosyltransferase involved in cell wall biosynthesis
LIRISVLTSVFNCEKFVGQAIESILGQTRKVDEIIVVNDGSTDSTRSVLERFAQDIRIIDLSHTGPARATNAGLAVATGNILCFLDADDLWTEDKTEKQLDLLSSEPSLDAVFGLVRQFQGNDLIPMRVILQRASAPQPGISKNTMMIRRPAFDRVGRFASTLQAADFSEWYMRAAAAKIRSRMLDVVVAFRRRHNLNTGRTRRSEQTKENLQALREHLLRRRAQQ